jgi:hypothetical protein
VPKNKEQAGAHIFQYIQRLQGLHLPAAAGSMDHIQFTSSLPVPRQAGGGVTPFYFEPFSQLEFVYLSWICLLRDKSKITSNIFVYDSLTTEHTEGHGSRPDGR